VTEPIRNIINANKLKDIARKYHFGTDIKGLLGRSRSHKKSAIPSIAIYKTTYELHVKANATLSGKKLLAKIVNGVKQPTVFLSV
jgi:hypothetical protein